MKPDDKHSDYLEYLPVWKKCRDAAKGQRAIKAAKEEYLPSLAGQKIKGVLTEEYNKYIARANYFNATGRTVDTLVGMVFRKAGTLKFPESLKSWLDDITLTGETYDDFAKKGFREKVVTDFTGILVDMPQSDGEMTLAEVQALNIRPYLALYKAESIINWEKARINNAFRFKNVWLYEEYKNDEGERKPQVRQLTLENGFYEQVVWREGIDKDGWVEYSRIAPVKGNERFGEIPFYLGDETMELSDPIIEPLANTNISHYQTSADLRHLLHMASVPTLFITGHDREENSAPIALGSSTAHVLPEADAKAYFVQCGTEGSTPLRDEMTDLVQQMAALGSRIISPEKKQAEAAETANIRRGSENSILSSIAGVWERQLERALRFAVDWMGVSGDVKIELNRDYTQWNLGAQDLTALIGSVQAGLLSKESFFTILQYAELVDENLTFEQEQDRISSEPPALADITNGGD